MKSKTVEVLELARPNRAGIIDVVDSDGNVVPLDYSGEDFVPDVNNYSGEDFTKRNRIIVKMCDLFGRIRRRAGFAECHRGRGDYDRARRIERNRGGDISEVGRLAINACEVCPLKLDCELYGKLGEAVLNNAIDYKKVRTATSLTKTGKKRSGWNKGCIDNDA